MKKIIITIVLFCAVSMSALAQNTITMKFTGRNQNNDWIPLSYVLVENQTQRWQELVYYPDTILYMGTVGIDDYMQSEKVHLFQNVPNPFDGVTDFSLQLDEDQNILLEIYDMNGKLVAQYENSLPQGPHLFRATLTSPQTYLLSAKTENDRMHIKMVNKGNGGANTIEYLGQGSIQYELKSDSKGSSPYPFVAGDWMKYVGYANLCGAEFVSAPVNKAQNQSETINLIFTLPLPEVTANSATDVTITSAMLNGSANGHDCGLTEHGFCYGTSSGNLNNKVVAPGTADGDFLYDISSLTPGTTYYFKAYAQSITGTAFSSVQSFRTLSTVPTVTTTDVSSILPTSAVSGGNVTADGGATVTARGVCWSTSQNPMVSNSHTTDGSGTGSFTSSITGLNPNTTYYVRAYATNSEGTAYGSQVSFTTAQVYPPTVTTNSVSNITENSATSGGNVTADGGATVTARGVCWSTSQNPTVSNSHTTNGSGTGSFSSSITGLSANTTYYVRAYATNSVGTAYGSQVSFTTAQVYPPTVTTNSVSNITENSATCGGNVTSQGSYSVTARGVCWSTSQNPTVSNSHTTNGSGTGSFTSSITGLQMGTTYYVRAYATNSVGTSYGTQRSFTTAQYGVPCPGTPTITDYDNNTYNTVQIGQQCWMKQNLKTTHYSDGTSISLGSSTSTTTAYRYYPNNNSSNVSTYGYLYNWKAVMRNSSSSSANPSGVQGICPTGWHVPSDAEWTQLTDYVSSQSQYVCGSSTSKIAKALASTTGWDSYSGTCCVGDTPSNNNATGFSAVPAGYFSGSYHLLGGNAFFWSATQKDSDDAYGRYLYYSYAYVKRDDDIKNYGFSVRCLRDESSVDVPTVTTTSVTNITQNTATSGGNITADGGATVTARGVCWSTSQNPTVSNSHTTNGSGTGSFTSSMTGLTAGTTYYVRAYATNSVGTAYGSQVSFTTNAAPQPCPGAATVTDYDGNTYNTVQIGQQCWMKQNLRTTHYSDGTSISLGSSTSTTTAYRYYPNNNSSNVATYGYLYNWKAVMRNSSSSSSNPSGVQGICPTGWHVPSDAEWTQLTNYVGSQSAYQCGGNSTNIAKALASTTGWNSSTTTCAVGNTPANNNATGFSAVPAGYYGGSYNNFSSSAGFWSATQDGSSSAYRRYLSYGYAYVYRANDSKNNGFSVRCLRDESTVADGQPCPGAATVTDYDGNTYNTVKIGNQCWMKQNLKTTHYSDGTSISLGSSTSTTTAYRYYPNNNSSNVATYGYLYNWKAVMRNSSSSSSNPSGVQGICPTGWHVPSDAEWTQLTNYVGSQSAYQCNGSSSNIAKALASTTGWNSSTTTCAVGNNQSANNATGFAAVPAGDYYGSYSSFGSIAYFWSATQSGSYNAYYRYLRYDNASVNRSDYVKYAGYSVRCVRD